MSVSTSSPTCSSRTPSHWKAVATTLVTDALPFVVAFLEPLRWMAWLWVQPGHPSTWQIAVPLASVWIASTRLPDARRIAAELSQLFPNPDAPQRTGPMWLMVAGALLLVAAHVSISPPVAMFGLTALLSGWVLRRHGPFVLRGLAPAFWFLLLAVPVPHQLTGAVAGLMSLFFNKIAAQMLTTCGLPTQAIGPVLYIGASASPVFTAQALPGFFVIPATLVAVACLSIVDRSGLRIASQRMALTLLVAGAVNFLAICALALVVHQTGNRSILTFPFKWAALAFSLACVAVMFRLPAVLRSRSVVAP